MKYSTVRGRFNYDENTGSFTYRISTSYRTKVGDEAGWLWTDKNKKYRKVKVKGTSYNVHRLIWLWYYGTHPVDQLDHINGNSLDNRISNLREVDNITNSMNRSIQSNNTSGYHGINQLPSGNWRVRININKKRVSIGTYDSFELALDARKTAEEKYNYHINHGRNNGF